MKYLLVVFLCIIPYAANAAVTFSEIAWMGSVDSPNDEWIELYNNGNSSVAVDGWTITDGANLSIALSGTIPSQGYAVLERTDDTAVAGGAFLIYTGALANTGSTLSLYRTDNSLEDQVAGGENWENIGGDNVTKKTPQHTSGGWKTAVATPGRGLSATEITQAEVDEDEEDENNEESVNTNQDDSDKKSPVIELQLPNVLLSLSPHIPDIAYVNQNVVFDVTALGLGKTHLDSLEYTWNFGDFSIAEGKKSTHTYTHPGEYVVTVHAAFARHEQVARKTIKVLPVQFSVTHNSEGDVVIHNNAKYEVNISGYILKGEKALTFPPRSIILQNGSITVPKKRLGVSAVLPVALYDQKSALVASTFSSGHRSVLEGSLADAEQDWVVASLEHVPESEPNGAVARTQQTQASNFSFLEQVTNTAQAANEDLDGPVVETSDKALSKAGGMPPKALPLLGLIGIVTVGLLAVVLTKRRDTEEI